MAVATAGDKRKQVYLVKSIDVNATINYANKPGTYQGVELIYERDYQGKKEVKTKNFAAKSLEHPAQSAFRSALVGLTKGDMFTVSEEFDGTYWNWKAIEKGGEAAQSPQGNPAPATHRTTMGASPKKDVVSDDNLSGLSDYELGVTCGMALNNAVILLGEKSSLSDVERLGYDFVKMAMKFKANVRNGSFGKEAAKPAQAPQAASAPANNQGAGFDDDIPF